MHRPLLTSHKSSRALSITVLALSALLTSCGTGATSQDPAPTGTPPSGSVNNRYLYVGVAAEAGGVQGFHVDAKTGALAEVPGSPLLFAAATPDMFSQAGALGAANGHGYVGFGPPNLQPPVLRSYAVDPATGSLGNFTQTDAGALSGDEQMRTLVADPSGRNLYVLYQNDLVSFQVNFDGSLTNLGTLTNLATGFIFSLAISPTANIAFLGVDNCPPPACSGPPDILLLNRDPASGLLTSTHKMMGQHNVWSPGALAFDPSGKYLLAWTIAANDSSQISVFRVDSAGGALTLAATYAVPAGLSPVAFAFDPSGKLLYVLESSAASPNPESVAVYGFAQQTGTLTQLQSESLPSGNFPAALLADDSFVFVANSQAGTVPSVIYVLARDAVSGMLSAPVFTLTDTPGGTHAGLRQAAELRF